MEASHSSFSYGVNSLMKSSFCQRADLHYRFKSCAISYFSSGFRFLNIRQNAAVLVCLEIIVEQFFSYMDFKGLSIFDSKLSN